MADERKILSPSELMKGAKPISEEMKQAIKHACDTGDLHRRIAAKRGRDWSILANQVVGCEKF